jgi:hypothetical protein
VRAEAVHQGKRLPPEVASRVLRRRFFYTIPGAGRPLGLGRTQSYVAARHGVFPIEQYGKLKLIRRSTWDQELKRLKLRLARPRKARAEKEEPATTI